MRKRTRATTREPPTVPVPTCTIIPPSNSEMAKLMPAITPKIEEKKDEEKEPEEMQPKQEEIPKEVENKDNKDIDGPGRSIIIDHQLPICKDYFKTGYCTFGWSCKFLHIRDRSLLSHTSDDRSAKAKESETVTQELNLCPICKKLYSNPVILKCGHIFCNKCAMERFKTDRTCFVCGKDTEGIFNTYKAGKKE